MSSISKAGYFGIGDRDGNRGSEEVLMPEAKCET